jgi:hypothetical protein
VDRYTTNASRRTATEFNKNILSILADDSATNWGQPRAAMSTNFVATVRSYPLTPLISCPTTIPSTSSSSPCGTSFGSSL